MKTQREQHKKEIKHLDRDALTYVVHNGNYSLAKQMIETYEADPQLGCDFWLRKFKVLHRKLL